jgi:hypothetical protein
MRRMMIFFAIIAALCAIGFVFSCTKTLGECTLSGAIDWGGQAAPIFDIYIKDIKTGAELGKTYCGNSGAFSFDKPIPEGKANLVIMQGTKVVYEKEVDIPAGNYSIPPVSYKDMTL